MVKKNREQQAAEVQPTNTRGYCRPPAEHQWKPGQSGNPKGRPKGSRNKRRLAASEVGRAMGLTEAAWQKLKRETIRNTLGYDL